MPCDEPGPLMSLVAIFPPLLETLAVLRLYGEVCRLVEEKTTSRVGKTEGESVYVFVLFSSEM